MKLTALYTPVVYFLIIIIVKAEHRLGEVERAVVEERPQYSNRQACALGDTYFPIENKDMDVRNTFFSLITVDTLLERQPPIQRHLH